MSGESSIDDWPPLAEEDGAGEASQLQNLQNILLLEASSVSQGHALGQTSEGDTHHGLEWDAKLL